MAMNLYGRAGAFDFNIEGEDESDADVLSIPSHAFDLIIADECHRGYTSKETNVWRNVLNHFDAIKIGLTATPASHTVAYFGKPVFNYPLQQAIDEGFLVDYDAVAIDSKVLMNGAFLKEGEQFELLIRKPDGNKLTSLRMKENLPLLKLKKKLQLRIQTRKSLGNSRNIRMSLNLNSGVFRRP
jgi:type I restriction enzyme R subunit